MAAEVTQTCRSSWWRSAPSSLMRRKQAVLTSRYVETPALTWPQIAEALGLSLRQTYRLKNNAIAELCDMACGDVLAEVS